MSNDDQSHSQQLHQIIAEYLAAKLAGKNPDRQEVLQRHADLEEPIRAFFADQDRTEAEIERGRDEATLPPRGSAAPKVDEEATLPPRWSAALQGKEEATLPPRPSTPSEPQEDATLPPGAPIDGAAPLPSSVRDLAASRRPSRKKRAAPAPGTNVSYFGDYELLEEIARGGMGVVYKARQVNLNRIVALKMILSGQLASDDDVKRFYTEAEAAATLDHPGIVPIYEVGQYEGQHFFSMGFIQGQSLAAKVARGPLRPVEAAELAKKVCEAIAFAHSKGVIHRDLKPANILLDSDGEPKVTDFGLAKKTEAKEGLTTTGQILGTPGYMPPEQAAGKTDEIGPAADTYSLGAILYCLLTGRPPFQAATVMDTLLQVLEQDPVSPRLLNAEVPRDLETICLKCLRKQPARRYESAAAVAEDIGRWLNNEPILARPVSRLEKTWLWCRRKPAIASLWASLVVVTVAAAGIVYERQNAAHAAGLVDALVRADVQQVPAVIHELNRYHHWSVPLLRERLRAAQGSSVEQLHLRLALVVRDDRQVEPLYESLLRADAAPFPVIRDALANYHPRITDRLWTVLAGVETDPQQRRLRAAGALATYDPENARWSEVVPKVADQLVNVTPVFVGQWREALRPVANRLLNPLAKIFANQETAGLPRSLSTLLIVDYAKDDPELLARLVLDADARSFATLFPALQAHRTVAVEHLQAVLARTVEPTWNDAPLDPNWAEPSSEARSAIEDAHGILTDRFALCQDLAWEEFLRVVEGLRPSGYRPSRVRPYRGSEPGTLVAALWTRDRKQWELQTDLSKDQLPPPDAPAERHGFVPADVSVMPADDGSADRHFVLLWSAPSGADEKRWLAVELSAQQLAQAKPSFSIQGSASQTTIGVWNDAAGQQHYAGIWSNQGTPSEIDGGYEGFERVELPQWDVAVVPASLLETIATPARYAAVWRSDLDFESRLLTALPPEEMRQQCQQLVAQSYRPVGIAMDGVLSSVIWHRPIASATEKERLALQQSIAAVALLRLSGSETASDTDPLSAPVASPASLVWPLLEHQPDPRLRSYLLHRLAPYGADPAMLLARLEVEQEVSRRRVLILGIGEFARAKLLAPELQSAATAAMAGWYADDPDPGVHGAVEWSLRQMGGETQIASVRAKLATGNVEGDRQWYITKEGQQTFVILRPAEEFLMGSPVTEAERYQGPTGTLERRHHRRIGRAFAIATHEVTVEQYQKCQDSHEFDRMKAREDDAPANYISWYDEAFFCNWLSEREGIPPDQWCYDPGQTYLDGMMLNPGYLKRTGYRIPTEAEWEYACRSGATTSRYFGDTEQLLPHYAWYTNNSHDRWMLPVGSLKPNDSGLFDMHGNAAEWAHDVGLIYSNQQAWEEDKEHTQKISDTEAHITRGGSFAGNAAFIRSADRTATLPQMRFNFNGMRVARTFPTP